jgi:hypothetical protein
MGTGFNNGMMHSQIRHRLRKSFGLQHFRLPLRVSDLRQVSTRLAAFVGKPSLLRLHQKHSTVNLSIKAS